MNGRRQTKLQNVNPPTYHIVCHNDEQFSIEGLRRLGSLRLYTLFVGAMNMVSHFFVTRYNLSHKSGITLYFIFQITSDIFKFIKFVWSVPLLRKICPQIKQSSQSKLFILLATYLMWRIYLSFVVSVQLSSLYPRSWLFSLEVKIFFDVRNIRRLFSRYSVSLINNL